eukprot:CAMPEP_0113543680 /NCGR_PEP_ID=MMETSP0015_2-20120614/10288_1 /TAXON_ID=2838 /ORGANISM="Odontella" /LENGTH=683 /DNA_ID=CAMNT_0000443857 /DNA_START=197 /DNA_END=2248 /DNA_ORIENTATION=- /assembly_acc=CAM_ASM_000160
MTVKDPSMVPTSSGMADGGADTFVDEAHGKMNKWEEETEELSEDVYSLLYTAPFRSTAFAYAVFVVMFQWGFAALAMIDLIDFGASNPLRVPKGVDIQVTIVQALALILAVVVQDDMIEGFAMLNTETHFDHAHLGTSTAKWFLSAITQILEGLVMLLITFILIMQSASVNNALLNFAAMSFIWTIDDAGFALAKRGFVTDKIQVACEEVVNLKLSAPSKNHKKLKRFLFVLTCAVEMAGFGVIVHEQRTGQFLSPDTIFVQFGDSFDPFISAYSGVYVKTSKMIAGRAAYVKNKGMHISMIAFCKEEKTWTWVQNDEYFWLLDDKDSLEEDDHRIDPCAGWRVKSEETDSYDIREPSAWFVLNRASDTPQKFDHFYLASNDCSEGEKSLCSSKHGSCENNVCACNPGRYGLNCEFEEPCLALSVDLRQHSFPEIDALDVLDVVSDDYELLHNTNGMPVEVYHRPVYVAEYTTQRFDVLLFTGRRWVITDTDGMHEFRHRLDNTTQITRAALADYLLNTFHAGHSLPFSHYFVSEKMDVGSPSDALTPTGLKWYKAREKPNQISKLGPEFSDPIFDEEEVSSWFSESIIISPQQAILVDTVLICSVCGKDNSCLNLHDCIVETGVCNCRPGYLGKLCEWATPCEEDSDCNGGTCVGSQDRCGECPDGSYGYFCELGTNSSVAD